MKTFTSRTTFDDRQNYTCMFNIVLHTVLVGYGYLLVESQRKSFGRVIEEEHSRLCAMHNVENDLKDLSLFDFSINY